MNNWISYNKVELFCNFSIQPETAPFMLRSGKIRRERSCRSSTTTPSFHMKKVLSWTYLFHSFINIFIAPSFHHFMYQKMFFQYLNLRYYLTFKYWYKIKSWGAPQPPHPFTAEKYKNHHLINSGFRIPYSLLKWVKSGKLASESCSPLTFTWSLVLLQSRSILRII